MSTFVHASKLFGHAQYHAVPHTSSETFRSPANSADPNEINIEVLPTIDISAFAKSKISQQSEEENYDDAFFICNLDDVISKHARWSREFPRILPHYAVKCNNDPGLLKVLVAAGTGFDCASKFEISLMLKLGVDPDRIIFAHPCKPASHIIYARDNGVKLMVFDSEEELVKVKNYFPEAELVLRIKTDDSKSNIKLSFKFGAEIKEGYKLIKVASKMMLKVVGICFHVGSRCLDPNAFVKPLQDARGLFDYAATLGYRFTLLDIGGGYPGKDTYGISKIASSVNHQLAKLFPEKDFHDLRVISEPGAYFAASAFALVTCVIGKRNLNKNPFRGFWKLTEDQQKCLSSKYWVQTANKLECEDKNISRPQFAYYINDGLYGTFRLFLYEHDRVEMNVLKDSETVDEYKSVILGPTSNGLDRVIEEMLLPELEVGDWMLWQKLGDYTMALNTEYSGLEVYNIFYVISQKNLGILQQTSAICNINGNI